MKSKIGLAVIATAINVQASELNLECLGEVISKVNQQHTLAEGSAYAVRILHAGEFNSAVLVGHSDETDPTDYLVIVNHQNSACKVSSIAVASEAGGVTEYTSAESKLLDDATAARLKVTTQKAIALMDKIPTSAYDAKLICVVGDKVTARVPMTHWAKNDAKTMTGTLSNFPAKITAGEPKIKLSSDAGELISGNNVHGLYRVYGYVNNKMADFCIQEQKPVLE